MIALLVAGCTSDDGVPASTAPLTIRQRLEVALINNGKLPDCFGPILDDLAPSDLEALIVFYERAPGSSGTLGPSATAAMGRLGAS